MRLSDWWIASAEPVYQCGPSRCCAGTGVTKLPSSVLIRQVVEMCRSRLWLLYWVSTAIRKIPALTRLDSAKSTSRYMPPNGTAGLARSAVSGASRLPAPPASTMPRTRLSAISHPSRACRFFQHAIQDLLRFVLDAGQLSGTGERLRVELVDVFRARRAGGEPAILGDHLDAAQRL